MLQGRLISPVIVGRISIGKFVDVDGVKHPQISDEFQITSTAQSGGQWIPHPIAKDFPKEGAEKKLRSIPIRLMFDSPDNNFRSGYACFSDDNRQLCASSGDRASRVVKHVGVQEVECRGPDYCDFGITNNCKLLGRLMTSIESEFHKDPLSGFVFRSTGYNSANALASRMNQFYALTNGNMAGMPCNLVLRAKSNPGPKEQTFYYVDIEPRESLFTAVLEAKRYHKICEENGINLAALDKAVTACYAGMPFIEDPGDAEIIRNEFYPESAKNYPIQATQPKDISVQTPSQGGVADMLFEEQAHQEPSPAVLEIFSQIDKMTDLKLFASAKIWIKNKRGLKNETERQMAFDRLEEKHNRLKNPSQPNENIEYSIEMIEITNRIEKITDLARVDAAKNWLKAKQFLKNTSEFNKAMELLNTKAIELQKQIKKAA